MNKQNKDIEIDSMLKWAWQLANNSETLSAEWTLAWDVLNSLKEYLEEIKRECNENLR